MRVTMSRATNAERSSRQSPDCSGLTAIPLGHLEVSGCVSVPRHKSESPILATLTFRSVTSRARCELIEEPCARERPVPLQRGDRDTKRFRGFALAQAGEIPELDHAAGPRVDRFEP